METKCEQIVEADVKCDVNSELEEENEGSETDDGSECEEKSESEDRTESEERTQSEIKLDYESDAHNDSKTEIDEPLNETKAEDVREGEAPKPEAEATDENNKNTKNVQHDGEAVENGKKKLKEEKPPTKVVVRRLPPSMTKETFLEQVSPLPPVDYTYFVPADPSMGIYAFSRAYLNFITQEDLFAFTRTFDNYVFLDAKGQEYPAVVEFAPFQRVPKWRAGGGKKKDSLSGTLEADTAYQTFRDTLLAEEIELSKPGANTVKQHYFETENTSNSQEVATTPLLEFLKARRAEKARVKEERREEKRRKEAERKQKQKKRHDNSPDVKVLQPTSKDKKELKDKEVLKEGKNIGEKKRKDKDDKPSKEKPQTENRTREFKNRSGKSYQEERQKQAERREEQRKKSLNGTSDGANSEEKNGGSGGGGGEEGGGGSGGGGGGGEGGSWPSIGGGRGERKRVFESRKKSESEGGYNRTEGKTRGGYSKRGTRRETDYGRRNSREKKNYGGREERLPRTKVYKNSQEGPQPKKEGSGAKKTEEVEEQPKAKQWKDNGIRRRNSLGSRGRQEEGDQSAKLKKRRNSLGSESPAQSVTEKEAVSTSDVGREAKRIVKEGADSKTGEGQKKSDEPAKKDPRTERRIRNKDRPSLEIYRPGMGKFSKQRLEKEKALGSSTEVDSPSHSPSPTPKPIPRPT